MNKPAKRILILGAGVMQGPAIRSAKAMGIETIVIDGDPKAALASEADRFEVIDLKDIHKIEQFARKLKEESGPDKNGLQGIMTAGTDFSGSVAFAAEKLGLPGISYKTALDASDKQRMRERFKEAGLPSPAFFVTSAVPADPVLPFSYPVVVKPVDNMGARGCRRVDNAGELRTSVETALHFSRSGRVIVEEYMNGPEFSVDALVYRGKITICGLADRHIFFPPYFIEMGHTMPAAISQNEEKALIDVFIRGIRALGIDNGAAKGDIKLTGRGPMIGEIAARLSGGYMSGWTYPYASGVNLTAGAICIALGKEPERLEPERNWTSAERAFISIPGMVNYIEGTGKANAIPGIKDIFLRAEPGKRIFFPENNVSKAGNVISAAQDRKTAVKSAEDAAKEILIRLAVPDTETETFLAGSINPESDCFPPPAYTLDKNLLEQLEKMEMTAATITTVPDKTVPDTVSVTPFPAFLDSTLKDYMGRNPKETLEAVRKLTGLSLPEISGIQCKSDNRPVLGCEFWTAFVRGGYQGAVYYIDRLFINSGLAIPGV